MTWDPKRKEWESQYLEIQRDSVYLDRVAQEIKAFDIQAKDRSILDAGCGPGAYLHHLLAQKPERIVGFDISPFYMTRLRNIEQDALFVQGSANQLPFANESFDLVIFLNTLLHVNPQNALDEIRRVLRPGGVLWVSHNLAWYYWWKIRYLNNRSMKKYAIETLSSIKRLTEPFIKVTGRVPYTTTKGFERLLSPLRIEKQSYVYSETGIPCQVVAKAIKPQPGD